MIDDMAPLKKAMEQMDAEDPDVAQAAKEQAAQTLSDAKLSFSKLAELIEQRRLLLAAQDRDRPQTHGSARHAWRRGLPRRRQRAPERRSELSAKLPKPSNLTADPRPNTRIWHRGASPLRQAANEMPYGMPKRATVMGCRTNHRTGCRTSPCTGCRATCVCRMAEWCSVFVAALFLPVPTSHKRFLMLALVAFLLFYALRGIVGLGQPVTGHPESVATARRGADSVMSSVSSFINEQILRRTKEPAATPTPQAPIPSPSVAVPSLPSANQPAAPPTASGPPATVATPSANARGDPSRTALGGSRAVHRPPLHVHTGAAPCREVRREPHSRTATKLLRAAGGTRLPGLFAAQPLEDGRPLTFDDIIPEGARRNSSVAGPCVAGVAVVPGVVVDTDVCRVVRPSLLGAREDQSLEPPQRRTEHRMRARGTIAQNHHPDAPLQRILSQLARHGR